MLSPTNRVASTCVTTLCACACALTGLVAGCDDGATAPALPAPPALVSAAPVTPPTPATPPAPAPEARKPEPMPGGGVHLDMRGEGRHVRGLQRQPDGTWKSVCVDAPDALRPRAGGPGGAARAGGAP